MTAELPAAMRPLTMADAPACDEVIRSLPYHFGDPDGQRKCAEAVRTGPGLVNLWPNHPALLLAMPLEVLHDEVRG